jgi:hypothetical protein
VVISTISTLEYTRSSQYFSKIVDSFLSFQCPQAMLSASLVRVEDLEETAAQSKSAARIPLSVPHWEGDEHLDPVPDVSPTSLFP